MPVFDFVTDLTLIVLLAVLLGATAVIAWRGQVEKRRLEQVNQNIQKHLGTSFALGGYLLEAHDEETLIRATMRAGNELLEADGCAFVPLNEWTRPLPVLKYGQAPFLQNEDWQSRLLSPATRHACRNCESRRAGSECSLLQTPADAKNVYCLALRCGGREIGVVSYFFPAPPQISEEQHLFLAEMVRMTDLALDALRAHEQEKEALRLVQQPVNEQDELFALDAQHKSLFERLQYQAILDERARLAREIHDGLAQTLAFLKLEAARMQRYISRGEVASVDRTLQACYQTLSDAYLDARQAIDDLRHVPDESLSDWLQMTAADFKLLTGMTVEVTVASFDYSLPVSVKAQLVRIVQEALTNVRKHAQANAVSISITNTNGDLIVEIHDNGCGFSPEENRSSSKYGLRSMRERAETIGADFQIISTLEMGTTVRLRIPVREKAGL